MLYGSGAFLILDARSLDILREERKSKQAITDIHYSPAGDLLGVASEDGRVYVHSGGADCRLIATVETGIVVSAADSAKGAKCVLRRFDFSEDGRFLRMLTSTDCLLYYSLEAGVLVPNPVGFADTLWGGLVVPTTWQTQGMYLH